MLIFETRSTMQSSCIYQVAFCRVMSMDGINTVVSLVLLLQAADNLDCELNRLFIFSEGRCLSEGVWGAGGSCWSWTWSLSFCGNYLQRAELLLCRLQLLLWTANLLPVRQHLFTVSVHGFLKRKRLFCFMNTSVFKKEGRTLLKERV